MQRFTANVIVDWICSNWASYDKIGLRGFRTDPTKTELYSHWRWLETWKFGFWTKRHCTINVTKKTKALISCAVTAQLIRTFVFAYGKIWFSLNEAHFMVQYFEHYTDESFTVSHNANTEQENYGNNIHVCLFIDLFYETKYCKSIYFRERFTFAIFARETNSRN